MTDFDKALTLLKVAEKARDLPNLKPLHDAAMQELDKIANPPPQDDRRLPPISARDIPERVQTPRVERRTEKE